MVEAFGNTWEKCYPLTEKDILEVENKFSVSLPFEMRNLFLKCNGGRPRKTYFGSKHIEVELGTLIPIKPPESFKGQSLDATLEWIRRADLQRELIPFANDNGNAGVFCVDAKTGEVIYWVHDEPEDPLKLVCASLHQLLDSLENQPY